MILRSARGGARNILRISLLVAFGAVAPACSPTSGHFSEPNARAHLQMLADEIGSRFAGTPANARARAYLIDQLTLYGFDVRVQSSDAVRPEAGVTARVANIIAVKAGARREAVGLVAHYDSRHDTPGAADDGLGTAVALEAARVLAARASPTWSLIVMLTDGEEAGLMGARALTTDREVQERLATYLNLEAIGSDTPAVLFETGPGNEWLVERWARSAPAPAGGSYSTEIYERLPNDTDFTILKQLGVPGLNFAAIGDSYAYHTARDTAERVTPYVIRHMGQNVVAVVEGLERADILTRTPIHARNFDLAGRTAIAYGATTGRVIAVLAVVLAIVAEVRVLRVLIREPGLLRLVATAIWWIVVAAAVTAAMVAQPWALRVAREVYHPWYAYPWRLFSLIAIAGGAVGWALVRVGGCLPERVRGYGQPLGIWVVTLPVWAGLAISAEIKAAAAAYLWTIPLGFAALTLAALPLARPVVIRAASMVVLVVSGVLWLRMLDLLPFLVAVFGRLSVVTPSAVYAAAIALPALMVAPPLVAAVAGLSRGLVPWRFVAALWLLAASIAAGLAYEAPAYTGERPLRRSARYVHDGATGTAFWEVGSNEPGLDLLPAAQPGWVPVTDRLTPSAPVRSTPGAFRFRSRATPGALPPVDAAAVIVERGDEVDFEITVRSKDPAVSLAFAFPAEAQPLRANLAGVRVAGGAWWMARFIAAPPDGIALRATFRATDRDRALSGAVVVETPVLPEGTGWQRLPEWLPQDFAVWDGLASYIVPLSAVVRSNSAVNEAAAAAAAPPN